MQGSSSELIEITGIAVLVWGVSLSERLRSAGLLSWLAIFGSVFVLDQVTKVMVAGSLAMGESRPLFPGLNWTLVHNPGMAFGLLSNQDVPYKSFIVNVLSISAMAAVVYFALRTGPNERWTRRGLALILAGACGNILDRIRLGYVIDFVDAYYKQHHWPAFNVADSAICVGVGLLIMESFVRGEENPPAAEPSQSL